MGGTVYSEGNENIFEDDNVAEWSKALARGASPKGRGFKSHRYQFFPSAPLLLFWTLYFCTRSLLSPTFNYQVYLIS